MASSYVDAELVSPDPTRPSRTWGEVGTTELLAVLAAVGLADATIYRGHGYAGLAAFFVGIVGLLLIAKRRRRIRSSLWIIAGLLALLAGHLVWYGSILQVAAGVFLVVAFATSLDGQSPYLLNVLAMGSQAIAAGVLAGAEYLATLRRGAPRLNRPGVLNFMLPAVAFVVFSALFVLANPDAVSFVSRQLESIVNQVSDWLVRMALRPAEPVFWVAVALVTSGLLRPLLRLPPMVSFAAGVAGLEPAAAPLYKAFRNTLITVIGLFAVYLGYEFYTLWTRDFPAGFYYAGYAHEGAAWLTLALALATLTLSIVFSGRVLHDPRLPRLRLLAWVWTVQNLLLSLSVYNRLFIYIDFNGLTRMRIVGLFGISLVVVGFLLVVWKILREHDFPWLIHRQLWALSLTVYLFAITPVDWVAASYNVRRILAGNESASMQIGVHQLDLEGILALPPLLDVPTPEIRDGVAALIAQRYFELSADHLDRELAGWTAYQLSDQVALERFEAVRTKWQPFEDAAKRKAAIQRFHHFAYQWY